MNKYTILAQVTDLRGLHRMCYVHLWFVEAPDYFAALRRVTSDALPGFEATLLASWDGWVEDPTRESGTLFIHRNVRVESRAS